MNTDDYDIIQTIKDGERVTSNYAEIYFDDPYVNLQKSTAVDAKNIKKDAAPKSDLWVSPSDVLIGKCGLVPPFTSKITRGITHQGILRIGEAKLQKEKDRFLKRLTQLLEQNDVAWKYIQEQEKKLVANKVRAIYDQIFLRKSKIMQDEVANFFENTLRDMEHHLRSEVQTVLMSSHCAMISDLSEQIKEKLKNERSALQKVLRERYDSEMKKINRYYHLLLENEKHRSNKLINNAIYERNEALKIFCKQADTEATTSTMYVMSTERKKCRMRQFLLETFHSKEIEDKLRTIKKKQNVIDEMNRDKKCIIAINTEWEERIKKILQLFLKFISYSLKLLPEQTTFLLDLEKLVVLQLNEIEKHPRDTPRILVKEEEFQSFFRDPERKAEPCDEPFVIEGDTAPSVSTEYGSQEDIPLHKDLNYFRLQRKYLYVKCQKLKQVQDYLESVRCKCHDPPTKEESIASTSISSPEPMLSAPSLSSSDEPLRLEDFGRLNECPDAACIDYIKKFGFPNLNDYLDFTEENLARVDAILGTPVEFIPAPDLLDPKKIVAQELPFAVTKEPYRTKETQTSSVEDLPSSLECKCMRNKKVEPEPEETIYRKEQKEINQILLRRKKSLQQFFHENPNLLQVFTDENEDFIM